MSEKVIFYKNRNLSELCKILKIDKLAEKSYGLGKKSQLKYYL